MTERELLARTAALAADYLETLDTRPVRPEHDYRTMLAALDGPVPEGPSEPAAVVGELARTGEPGVTAMGSGRYFGFVIGGALPASLAADWLVSAWDQNTGLAEPTPATSALEAVAGRWVARAPLPSAGLVVRVRDRLPDGTCHLPRRGAPGGLRPRWLGPDRAGPCRSAAAPCRGR
ncbi:MAG: hypothetical protein M5U27_11960 [Gaiella sp.]|nr:hypothetical protein [Gaiella sp.]